jgi:hypothetical protein
VALEQVEVAVAERVEALERPGRRGPAGGEPAISAFWKLARVLVEQRQREAGAVAEAAVEGAVPTDAARATSSIET